MRELIIILENIRSAHNVGALLRTAEALGAQEFICCGITPYPLLEADERLPHVARGAHQKIAKASLGAEKWLIVRHIKSTARAIKNLQARGFTIIAVEQDPAAQPLFGFEFSQRTALVLGNEVEGVTLASLRLSDAIVQIPQKGRKESLNVSSAGAIAIAEWSRTS